MEKIKATMPAPLRNRIADSKTEHLPSTCAELLAHLASEPQFPHLLQQLTDAKATCCAKDAEAALRWKIEGNTAFTSNKFGQALSCYSKALQYSPMTLDKHKETIAVLLVNRAFTLQKLGIMKAAERDCGRAIELHPIYSKAWYRRGRLKAELLDFEGAVSDMEKAQAYESSDSRLNQVKKELLVIKRNSNGAADLEDSRATKVSESSRLPDLEALQCTIGDHSTPDKGRGIVAIHNIEPGNLILREPAFAAVIMKEHRTMHCHFCFKLLPSDQVPCKGCTIPLYCSEPCRDSSTFQSAERPIGISEFSPMQSGGNMHGQHEHECGGSSWSAVLPSEAILATRMLVQSISGKDGRNVITSDTLTCELEKLCHHYEKLNSHDKLELHVLAVVIAHCLQSRSHSWEVGGDFLEYISSKLVILMSQVKANVMAVVALTSPESNMDANFFEVSLEKPRAPNNITCSVEHVKVAQAIFLQGSAFNHSCTPNAHASFVSRHLYLHSTKPIIAGSPVELCYGVQAGEQGRLERQSWLKERYFFDCRCFACSEANISDVYISAYRCHNSSCDGAVPADSIFSKISLATKESSDGYLTSEEQQDSRADHERSTACCIKCRLLVDTKSYQIVLRRNINNIKRASTSIQTQFFDSKQLQCNLEIACASLKNLRLVLHHFNKVLAEAEDTVAKLLCATGQPQKALLHCGNSIKILEQLYGKDHIVVANERMKFASIALAANNLEQAKNNLEFVKRIYCVHYGPKFQERFPFMEKLLASCP